MRPIDAALPTREALYRAILADPEDVTLRLAFADHLDEQPKPRVKCPKCKGSGQRPKKYADDENDYTCSKCGERSGVYGHYVGDGKEWTCEPSECKTCGGEGTVPDARDADLAEFIRVQVELATNPGGSTAEMSADRWHHLRRRESELLRIRGDEWRRAVCPACRGKGGRTAKVDGGYGTEFVPCQTCGGSGDLFKKRDIVGHGTWSRTEDRPVVFRNGFVDSVGCELRELQGNPREMGEREPPVFVPSPWAAGVVTRTPVTRFVDPRCVAAGPTPKGDYWWVRQIADFPRQDHTLPTWQFNALEGGRREVVLDAVSMFYPTAESAADALALAAGRLVRAAVYGKAVPQ